MAINGAIVAGLLLALATLSTESPTCCDFSPSYPCTWNTIQWQAAPGAIPVTSPYYPHFYPTPDGYYEWLEDVSNSLVSTTTFTVTSATSGFSFDYYYNTPDSKLGNYLQVIFKNTAPPISTLIADITVPVDAWRPFSVICDGSVNYCCGSLADVPCTGTIEIVGNTAVTPNQALFAIDNFCGDSVVTTTTVSPITLPTPRPDPSGCCQFDTDICGFYSYGANHWYWSVLSPPPLPPPPFADVKYMWANYPGATLEVSVPITIASTTYFTLDYYISNPSVAISVSFNGVPINTLTYSTGLWEPATLRTTSWCPGPSCTGIFSLTVTGSPGYLVAIDNAGIDGSCHDVLPCCYFDYPNFCGMVPVPPVTSYAWQWSGYRRPTFLVPPPTSGSDFIYFEAVPYTGSGPYTATLRSQLIEIGNTAKFSGYIYVDTPDGDVLSDSLQLNFHEAVTGIVTTMDFAKDTYSIWSRFDFFCRSPHDDCCQGQSPSCRGYLELSAYVKDYGQTAFYGIDALEIDDKCYPYFPGNAISPRYALNATHVQ